MGIADETTVHVTAEPHSIYGAFPSQLHLVC